MDSLPHRIYKYLGPERVDVLTKRVLRYTPIGAFNDPFEGRPHITALMPDGEVRETMRGLLPSELKRAHDDLAPDVRAQIPYDVFVSLAEQIVTADEPDMLALFSELTPNVNAIIQRKLDESIGVLSLSEVPDSLLMWSHYAIGHTGFVLGFDPRHPYFNESKSLDDELRHLRRVVYRESRPSGTMTALDGINMFLVKSGHWAYEREWRILRPLMDAKETVAAAQFPIHLFQFPASALKELIIGARASERTKRDLLATIRADAALQHVRIRQSTPHDEHFMLRLLDVAI